MTRSEMRLSYARTLRRIRQVPWERLKQLYEQGSAPIRAVEDAEVILAQAILGEQLALEQVETDARAAATLAAQKPEAA